MYNLVNAHNLGDARTIHVISISSDKTINDLKFVLSKRLSVSQWDIVIYTSSSMDTEYSAIESIGAMHDFYFGVNSIITQSDYSRSCLCCSRR